MFAISFDVDGFILRRQNVVMSSDNGKSLFLVFIRIYMFFGIFKFKRNCQNPTVLNMQDLLRIDGSNMYLKKTKISSVAVFAKKKKKFFEFVQ